jgi:fibronectin type 3 domain-containing protein
MKKTKTGILLFIALSLAAACSMVWDGPQDTDTPAPTAAPSGLKAESVAGGIKLSWENVADALHYTIYRSGNGGPYAKIALLRAADLTPPPSYTDAALASGTDYSYRVSVTKISGDEGFQSLPVFATTKQIGQPALSISSASPITLEWTAFAGATGYNVYYYNGNNPDTDPFALLTPSPLPETTLSYADSNSVTTGVHYYKVVALNAQGNEGEASKYICTVPRNGKIIFLGTSSLTLSWEAVPSAALYKIYRSISSGGPYTAIPENPPGVPTPVSTLDLVYTDSHKPDLTPPGTNPPYHAVYPGTPYYYVVSAIYPDGSESDLSSDFEFSGETLPAPPLVTALLLPPATIELTWTAAPSPPGISYNVYHAPDIAGPYTLIGSGITAPPYTHGGIAPDIRHFYKVCTVYEGHEIDFGTSISSPTAPTGIGASPASSASITVSWTAVSEPGATYTMYRSPSGAGPYAQIAAGAVSPYTDSGLASGTTYYYRISTVIGGFEGPQSQALVSATTNP